MEDGGSVLEEEIISAELGEVEDPIAFSDWRSQAVGVVWAASTPGFIEVAPELRRDISGRPLLAERCLIGVVVDERERKGERRLWCLELACSVFEARASSYATQARSAY